MKRLILALFTILFVSSNAFADDTSVEVLVPTYNIPKGTIVSINDFELAEVTQALSSRYITVEDSIDGLETKRNLYKGKPVIHSYIGEPELVKRNEGVTLVFVVNGLTLTTVGKSIDDGSLGDIVEVINTESRKKVSGVVIDKNVVQVNSNVMQ